jgi:hypothetical protein
MTTTNNISTYIKDTEDNIRKLSRTSTNTWAAATDTGRLFLIKDGALYQWQPTDTASNSYTWTDGSTELSLPGPVVAHFDATNPAHMLNQTLQPAADGQSVSRLNLQNSLFQTFRATGENSPVYRANMFGSKPGLELNRAGLTSDEDLTMEGSFTVMMVMKWLPRTFTNYYGARPTDTTSTYTPEHGNEFDPDSLGYNSDPMFWGSTNPTTRRTYDRYIGSWAVSTEAATNTGWQWYTGGGGIRNDNDQPGEFQSQVGMGTNIINKGANGYTDSDLSFDPLGVRGTATPIIMSYRYNYDPKYSPNPGGYYYGTQELKVNGGYRGLSKLNAMLTKPAISGLHLGIDGTHILGEVLILNSDINNEQYNRLGSALANKWGGSWYGVNY